MSPVSKQKHKTKTSNPTIEDVRALGSELLTSTNRINNVPRLLAFLSPSSPPEFIVEAILSLQSFFVPLLSEIHSYSRSKRAADGDPEVIYKEWLRSRFDEFVDSLVAIVVHSESEEAIIDFALDAIMEFVKHGKGGGFQFSIYHKFINDLVYTTSSVDYLLNLLAPNFFKYVDVRFYTYTSLIKIANKLERTNTTECHLIDDKGISESRVKDGIRSIYIILSRIPSLESQDGESGYMMWCESGFLSKLEEQKPSMDTSPEEDRKDQKSMSTNNRASGTLITKKLKVKFTKAWTSFLKLPLSLDVYKEVLATIHHIVIPNIANPVILCDFFTRSYDIGGVISVMALSGLYILMTEHGLEYLNFYTKLYALLVPNIFMAKYRARFFQLLDTSLKSAYVPAYLAAAFAKRLSRLAVSVPPSGALVIIAIIHNLLRRHPSINFLVHKLDAGETDGDISIEGNGSSEIAGDSNTGEMTSSGTDGSDPFIIEESEPVKSNAMRSSLWEIDTLRHHYCPAVSRFVASLENDLTIRNKTSEVSVADFASGSYGTIFGEEVRRRIKQVPLAFYKVVPTSLFSESDFAGWSFESHPCNEPQEGNVEDGSLERQEIKRQKVEC